MVLVYSGSLSMIKPRPWRAVGFSTKSKANSALAAASVQLTFSPWNLVTTNVGITKQNTKQSYAAMPANIKLAKRSEKGLLTPDNCGQAVDYASMMVHKAPASR